MVVVAGSEEAEEEEKGDELEQRRLEKLRPRVWVSTSLLLIRWELQV